MTEAARTPAIQGQSEDAVALLPVAGAPQTWQNWAPALKGAAQLVQAAELSGVEQLLQNFPDAGWPHFGHVIAVIGRLGSERIGR